MAGSPIVIVGAGQGGMQAAASLRDAGFDGPVTLVGAEPQPPYDRPPLSKQYLNGEVDAAALALRTPAFYQNQDIDLRVDTRVAGIDRANAAVVLDSGARLPYERLILATGSIPRRLPVPGADHPGVLVLRTLAQARVLRDRLAAPRRVVVIGAGFTGLEVAAAARSAGHEVTVIEALDRVLARAVSVPVSEHVTRLHRGRGVDIRFGRQVEAIEGEADGPLRAVRLAGGESVPADLVVVGIGVVPDTALAAEAGLAVANGVVVDAYLRTSDPAIHAIGDCALFPSPFADDPLRLESVQNAVDQAKCAAEFIAKDGLAARPYSAVPWFWTDQYSDKLQIAGITTGHDRTELAGDPEQGRFSVHCFRGERLVGVESINRPAEHIKARRQLAAAGTLAGAV
ncbi:NAD(P)/FAD-dependent oxidoreductase [Actinocrinis sp.]|uniref:NAD(P)/FAD-dependent oxidoreductase n=1 Tax=Actinocrinis sp. TaxID=1920516 RepID=UPI002C307DAE|nr:FAD-dependent oxidoreductase [Actinocrinis sp.]HXR70950.1 FAD-dependent oxidoreductase [Actinocrinis sp.]